MHQCSTSRSVHDRSNSNAPPQSYSQERPPEDGLATAVKRMSTSATKVLGGSPTAGAGNPAVNFSKSSAGSMMLRQQSADLANPNARSHSGVDTSGNEGTTSLRLDSGNEKTSSAKKQSSIQKKFSRSYSASSSAGGEGPLQQPPLPPAAAPASNGDATTTPGPITPGPTTSNGDTTTANGAPPDMNWPTSKVKSKIAPEVSTSAGRFVGGTNTSSSKGDIDIAANGGEGGPPAEGLDVPPRPPGGSASGESSADANAFAMIGAEATDSGNAFAMIGAEATDSGSIRAKGQLVVSQVSGREVFSRYSG